MENRFRLVQQPVASLQGDDPEMFDVLVRMVDPQGKEVLPAEFMAAAERNDLLKNIDRWVVGASLSFAAQREPRLPVRAPLARTPRRTPPSSTGSTNHVRSSRAEPQRAVLPGHRGGGRAATSRRSRRWRARLRQRGFRFALEGFGSGRDPQGLLDIGAARLRQDRRRAHAGPDRRSAAAAARARAWSRPRPSEPSRPSPSASRMPTPWPCCGSSACSTSRATSSTRPKKS